MTEHRAAVIPSILIILVALSTVPAVSGGAAEAETTNVSSWLPNVGRLGFSELPLGDLWTFRCPRNAVFNLTIDTKDDNDNGRSCIDPMFVVYDGRGTPLVVTDDDLHCSYEPICREDCSATGTCVGVGGSCPRVLGFPCGEAITHSIAVRDAGPKDGSIDDCTKGGGYELRIAVVSSTGTNLTTLIGGGPARNLPSWLQGEGFMRNGPALDDENIPCHATLDFGGGFETGNPTIVPCGLED